MRPQSRRMSRNDSSRCPTNVVIFDTESKSIKLNKTGTTTALRFKIACGIAFELDRGTVSRRVEFQTFNVSEFHEWIVSRVQKKKPLWAFAHNLMFDLTQLDFWTALDDGFYSLRSETETGDGEEGRKGRGFRGALCTESPPSFAIVRTKNGTVKFVDSMNYLPMTLEKIGLKFDFPKLPFPGFDCSKQELAEYCLNDCRVLEKAVLELFRKWKDDDCGVWQLTAPMLSLTSFRHLLPRPRKQVQKGELYLSENPDWDKFERLAYYGGQVSCFYVGPVDALPVHPKPPRPAKAINEDAPPQGPLFMVDVNSLYPAVMALNPFPCRRARALREPSIGELKDAMFGFGAIANVVIDSEKEEFPVRLNGEQWHCVGQFETVLAGPELARALAAGAVRKVWRAQLYSIDYLFRKWVDKWYSRKLAAGTAGDEADLAYSKLLLNALSGKFAQKSGGWALTDSIPCIERWGRFYHESENRESFIECRGIAGRTFKRVEEGLPWYSFPAISAFITSYGREFMRRVRGLLPRHSCLYQATDALILTQEGMTALERSGMLHPTELGLFHCVGSAEDGEIIGHNHYRFGSEWTRAGAWGAATLGEDGTYRYTAWQSVDSIVSTKPTPQVILKEMELSEFTKWRKGKTSPGGWVSWPKESDFRERF